MYFEASGSFPAANSKVNAANDKNLVNSDKSSMLENDV